MLNHLRRSLAFMAARWRVWSPPLLLTVLVFLVAVFLTKGRVAMPFLYRLF